MREVNRERGRHQRAGSLGRLEWGRGVRGKKRTEKKKRKSTARDQQPKGIKNSEEG